MVRMEKTDEGPRRCKVSGLSSGWGDFMNRLPLTGIACLALLALVTILIPACQSWQRSAGGQVEMSRDSRIPAALRG